MKGVIKWLDKKKGMGFIGCEDRKVGIIHLTIEDKGFNDGDEVEFDLSPGDKGIHKQAVNVRRKQ